jgi:hypothetical protein
MVDFREVINDINIINPAFVLHTGDLVNEGELEYYLGRRYYTKAQRILKELEVPVYVVAGNHDIGGWTSTPPPDGSSRWTWWSFFGWRHLYDPPGSDPIYTQNYTFDYSDVHFIGMEAYDNYDSWRYNIYGGESFTNRQMEWLANDVASIDPATPTVLFYHYDFGHELDLAGLGIDCTLWGHIHSTSGSIASPPFNLSTDALCDGRRTFRVVRVSGDEIIPSKPIKAGGSGQMLTLDYDGPNDGTRSTLTATVTNNYNHDFEHAMVRFHVRADSIPYAVDVGELKETIVDGTIATCYVGVPLAADSTVVCTIRPCPGLPDDYGNVALLRQNYPNPAPSSTTIAFVLPFRAQARLEISDLAGRRVRTLIDGETLEAGPNEKAWDLTDRTGSKVASGIYFYRLEAGEDVITRKMVVVKD